MKIKNLFTERQWCVLFWIGSFVVIGTVQIWREQGPTEAIKALLSVMILVGPLVYSFKDKDFGAWCREIWSTTTIPKTDSNQLPKIDAKDQHPPFPPVRRLPPP